jgi:small Trp-rich protein
MYLLLLGLLLLLLKYLQIGPVAGLGWGWVLSPFALAVLWWWWADRSGHVQRQQARKMDERKARRLDKGRKRLGLPPLDKRR